MTNPIKTVKTLWGTYQTFATRERKHRATHPITGQDLGIAFDELMKVKEGKKTWWRIGRGVGSDGCAYGGGMIYKTKRAAVKDWHEYAEIA